MHVEHVHVLYINVYKIGTSPIPSYYSKLNLAYKYGKCEREVNKSPLIKSPLIKSLLIKSLLLKSLLDRVLPGSTSRRYFPAVLPANIRACESIFS